MGGDYFSIASSSLKFLIMDYFLLSSLSAVPTFCCSCITVSSLSTVDILNLSAKSAMVLLAYLSCLPKCVSLDDYSAFSLVMCASRSVIRVLV
jgi:hypothetical protein